MNKSLLVMCLYMILQYIYDSLGAEFLEATVLDLELMLDESDDRMPLVCLLSTGSDPSGQIETMARSRGQPYRSLALGQGQEETARPSVKYISFSSFYIHH